MINSETQILGLIGNNILHSKSFALHNAVMKEKNINGVYLPFQIKNNHFFNCLQGLFSIRCIGVNITIPFKEKAFTFVDSASDDAREIQAINTIVREDNRWVGYNTDHFGFWKSLEEQQISVSGRPIFIWGAGGAAKSVCYALKKQNVSNVSPRLCEV